LRQYKTPSKWYNEHQVLNRGCFCMGKNVYSSEIKWAVVKVKMAGELTTNEIMEKYGIKNKSQISTWVRWYKQGELYRFDQPIAHQRICQISVLKKNEDRSKGYPHHCA